MLDGFFPYELKGDYPEGVLFSLCDKRHLSSDAVSVSLPHQWGAGRTLDSRQGGRGGVAAQRSTSEPSDRSGERRNCGYAPLS